MMHPANRSKWIVTGQLTVGSSCLVQVGLRFRPAEVTLPVTRVNVAYFSRHVRVSVDFTEGLVLDVAPDTADLGSSDPRSMKVKGRAGSRVAVTEGSKATVASPLQVLSLKFRERSSRKDDDSEEVARTVGVLQIAVPDADSSPSTAAWTIVLNPLEEYARHRRISLEDAIVHFNFDYVLLTEAELGVPPTATVSAHMSKPTLAILDEAIGPVKRFVASLLVRRHSASGHATIQLQPDEVKTVEYP